ncbi:MAG TPA: hypothetical protein VFN90_02085 [Gemmatimonadales bacterium]|nr:hypothetical protein [Gemmatimonadales bacterium]
MRLLLLAGSLAVVGCAAGSGAPGTPTPLSALRPEDRVVIGDVATVQAIASSQERVYVVHREAIGIWRPLERHWEVPRRTPPGISLVGTRAAIVDPLDQSVVIATATGWVRYSADIDRWDRGVLPSEAIGLAIDRTDPAGGVWIRTRSGWFQLSPLGAARPGAPPARLEPAPTLADAERDLPMLRSLAGTIALGPGFTPGQLTSAAPSPDRRGWFLGTSTAGLLFLDRFSTIPERVGVGLPGESVAALALLPNGVWVATDPTPDGRPAGVTFLRDDLGSSTALATDRASGLPYGAPRALLPGDRVLWLGGDRGLLRLGIDDGRALTVGQGGGLPDQRILALAQWRNEIVAGTMRGVVSIAADGTTTWRTPSIGFAVRALAPRGDTLYVGTDRGVAALLPGDTALRVPEGYRLLPGGGVPVVAIGMQGDTLVAVQQDRIAWRDPVQGAWQNGSVVPAAIGAVRVAAFTDYGIWLAGDAGVALMSPTLGVVRVLTVGADFPDRVTSVVADRRYLWVGTWRGLVRIALAGG